TKTFNKIIENKNRLAPGNWMRVRWLQNLPQTENHAPFAPHFGIGQPEKSRAEQHGDKSARNAEAELHPAKIDEQNNPQRGQANDRMGKRSEKKAQRDKAQGNSRKRGKQGSARSHPAYPLGDKRSQEFDDTATETG